MESPQEKPLEAEREAELNRLIALSLSEAEYDPER